MVATRDDGAQRRWLQLVTDTEENRRTNHVDELWVVEADGTRRRLDNERNRDLFELYAWTLPELPDRIEWAEVSTRTEPVSVAGRMLECRISTLTATLIDGRLESSECDAFVWSHGPGSIHVGARVLWRVEVVDASSGSFGR